LFQVIVKPSWLHSYSFESNSRHRAGVNSSLVIGGIIAENETASVVMLVVVVLVLLLLLPPLPLLLLPLLLLLLLPLPLLLLLPPTPAPSGSWSAVVRYALGIGGWVLGTWEL
jgi:hypothetical protein